MSGTTWATEPETMMGIFKITKRIKPKGGVAVECSCKKKLPVNTKPADFNCPEDCPERSPIMVTV